MIANAASQPGKIVATAQASNGSVANINGIAGGALESGFSHADVATWAQAGTGMYEGKPHVPGLRLIAKQELDLAVDATLSVLKLVELLEELDDVAEVFHNVRLSDEALAALEAE